MEGKRPKKRDIESGVKRVLNNYHSRGLRVTQINTYNEFACVREEVRIANMNIVAAGEHVRDIEISGRTLKEGTRGHVHRLPYKQYPKIMVI